MKRRFSIVTARFIYVNIRFSVGTSRYIHVTARSSVVTSGLICVIIRFSVVTPGYIHVTVRYCVVNRRFNADTNNHTSTPEMWIVRVNALTAVRPDAQRAMLYTPAFTFREDCRNRISSPARR